MPAEHSGELGFMGLGLRREVWAGCVVTSLRVVTETMRVEFTWDRWGVGA